ncbi:MAG: ECF-type sigma factor [Gemmatimonadales bacterium]
MDPAKPSFPLDAGTTLDRETLDHLYSAAYAELKRLAHAVRAGERSETLTTTSLVNDAWLKLARSPSFTVENGRHFKRIVVRAMRQLLVEAARRRSAAKRGGGAELVVTIRDDLAGGLEPDAYVLALDSALGRFSELYPRQARAVEVRYFGGLDVAETAELLEVSRATVERDCRFAKAWLGAELKASC